MTKRTELCVDKDQKLMGGFLWLFIAQDNVETSGRTPLHCYKHVSLTDSGKSDSSSQYRLFFASLLTLKSGNDLQRVHLMM